MLMKSRDILYRNLDRNREVPEISSAQKEYLRECKKESFYICNLAERDFHPAAYSTCLRIAKTGVGWG